MALTRRERAGEPVERWPFERGLFDWPPRPLARWRHMLHEDGVKIEEFTEDGELAVRAEMPVSTPKGRCHLDRRRTCASGPKVATRRRSSSATTDARTFGMAHSRGCCHCPRGPRNPTSR